MKRDSRWDLLDAGGGSVTPAIEAADEIAGRILTSQS